MCLAVPGKVTGVKENRATVDISGIICEAGSHLVQDLKPGDYVIVHSGFIIEKLDEQDALKTLALFEELRLSQESSS